MSAEIGAAARERNQAVLRADRDAWIDLDARFHVQRTHLTTPATVKKYVEAAVTKSDADLVMLDLEDSIPRGDDALLEQGRANIVWALNELDWGKRLRFFRPRGTALDSSHSDIAYVVSRAGKNLDGLVFPKVESVEEVRSIDETLRALEKECGIATGKVKIGVLIESVRAEESVFEIARASKRLACLIFGAFDYWSSLRMVGVDYRTEHPLVDHARARIVKAAASVGIPAIAEMTLNYPTKDKSAEDQKKALDECKRDAEYAKSFGFRGKWTGIPAQTLIARDVFDLPEAVIEASIRAVEQFREAEKAGRGAAMIDGKMSDRATDRMHRVVLQTARILGRLDEGRARDLLG